VTRAKDATEELAREAIDLLEAIVDDRGLLARLDETTRRRLLEAAGRVSRPERDELRAMAKALRKKDRDEVKEADEAVLAATGIREARRAPVFVTPPPALPSGEPLPEREAPTLNEARKCYVCKAPFNTVHAFYDQMCASCAELNWKKRNQTCDLSGRVALVTGARVKIGYHAAVKLLRAGCHVVVTTRFPRDAAARYAREDDYGVWKDRIEVHGLDLRHTPSVETFAQELAHRLPRLDFILNNACQTVRRPPGFYRHLMDSERQLPAHAHVRERELALFPEGKLDADLQQIDLRTHNSWRLTMDEVPAIELLEVQLVNAVAPFVLNARLLPLMKKVPTADKHVVNVSAMEGQFYRAFKTDRHPHTNMAKAALNMLTRTSATDVLQHGVHMNSVDTGWITDEDPAHIAERKVEEHGFSPPLDVVDGAARICDPLFDGFLTGNHRWGQFFKDYAPTAW
jgi:NAD(P)-dependent dehydrogenase (short-subunit alcohol dehydrogenase family)